VRWTGLVCLVLDDDDEDLYDIPRIMGLSRAGIKMRIDLKNRSRTNTDLSTNLAIMQKQ
jgi:hypothetical protein